MLKEILTVQDKVQSLLEQYSALRDNDHLLYLEYLNTHTHHDLKNILGVDAYRKFKAVFLDEGTPVFESVSRARRLLQEKGLCVGTNKETRKNEEQAVKKYFKTKERPQVRDDYVPR